MTAGLSTGTAIWLACVLIPAPGVVEITDVWVSGEGGYHTYRIPAIVATGEGTLLAFCEGRKKSRADHGDIDLLLKRSRDGGKTWEAQEVVHEEGGDAEITIGNPCAIVERETGTVFLLFTRDNEDVFVTSSGDDGRTWQKPRRITDDVKAPGWGWYATGPGIGIQLRRGPHAGRLLIPCDHREKVDGAWVKHSHVFLSDDRGRTWKRGGTVAPQTDECQVAELEDGTVVINMRNYWAREGGRPERGGMRAIARSRDGGETWGELEFQSELVEPVCQASLLGIETEDGGVRLFFSNPASDRRRHRMTVRTSADGGRTWEASRVLDAGPAAYSCLVPLGAGRIGILYERGDYERIAFAAFSLDWVEESGGEE